MRTVTLENGYVLREDGRIFNKKGHELKLGKNKKGYPQVGLHINGKTKTFRFARLLATHFIPNPDNLSDVDHIDGDINNNSLENLRWISHGDNIRHSYALGNRSAVGVNNANAKMSEEEVIAICEILEEGRLTQVEIARKVGVKSHRVHAIKKRIHWNHISCHYKW